MFGDYLLWDINSKKNADKIFNFLDKDILVKKKSIISIAGISGTRKSETAFRLAEILINNGKESHIISSDDYYITPWDERNQERKRNNYQNIGPEELDWKRIWWTLETFRNPVYNNMEFFQMSKFSTSIMQSNIDKNGFDILIFEGLYACDKRIDSDVKIHIGDTSPESTFSFRNKRKKENEMSEARRKVVEIECEHVEQLKINADLVL